MCWRIVRVEGDGSIKLLLEDSTYECNNASYNGNWSIGNAIAFGYDSNNKADFLGYTGGLADELKNFQVNNETPAGTLTKKVYDTYNGADLGDYLKPDTWCYDHNVTETSGSNEYYGAYTRVVTNKQPSNVCTGTKISKYRDNTNMYVGTLTADEIAFAGGNEATNTNYYIMNTYAQSNELKWWALSPYGWYDEISWGTAFSVNYAGYLNSSVVSNGHDRVARPAVTLKIGTTLSNVAGQDGTKDHPYVIN